MSKFPNVLATPGVVQATILHFFTGVIPDIRAENGRAIFVFEATNELATAQMKFEDPTTSVNLRDFLDAQSRIRKLMYSKLAEAK